MLKVSTIDTRTERRLIVEGKLIAPWIDEFKRAWWRASEGLQGRKLVVDLKNATAISREAEDTLLELMGTGASISCEGVLTKYVVKQLMRRFRLCTRHIHRKPAKDSRPVATTEVELGTRENCG